MENFFPVPKPKKKEKKPYKGLQTKKPLQAKTSLKAKSTFKKEPKVKTKIPAKKRKKEPKPLDKLKVFKGEKIPSRARRNEFSDKEKEKILAARGDSCLECGSPYIEFHHAKFRSGSGRGVWRNGIPLCNKHHSFNHEGEGSRAYAERWREMLKALYGEFYYMDEWDLWLLGKIEEPTKEQLEAFMLQQEEILRQKKDPERRKLEISQRKS
jgi:hypothetical protein